MMEGIRHGWGMGFGMGWGWIIGLIVFAVVIWGLVKVVNQSNRTRQAISGSFHAGN
jgi:hypothetical protein